MKKFSLFIVPVLITFSANQLVSQDTSIVKYFPLSIGNVWIYRYSGGYPFNVLCKTRVRITSSFINNGKTYFEASINTIFIENGQFCGENMFTFNNTTMRIDSMNGNISVYSPGTGCVYSPNEKLFDSLKARKNDTIEILCNSTSYKYMAGDTGYVNVFGESRPFKSYGFLEPPEYHGGRTYVKGIGLWNSSEGAHYTGTHQLLGVVINGVVYGDTSFIVGINKISSEIPESFSLHQNYPNPFNPVTKIRFDIPSLVRWGAGVVVLKVYDILGREIQTLVNEKLSPGTYEVEFDGTNYASGVYYYTLTCENFSQTKRMVVVK
jgi:hypothetical protein